MKGDYKNRPRGSGKRAWIVEGTSLSSHSRSLAHALFISRPVFLMRLSHRTHRLPTRPKPISVSIDLSEGSNH